MGSTPMFSRFFAALHERPLLFWLLMLVYIIVWQGWWLVNYQPTYGRPLELWEIGYVIGGFVLLLVLLATGWTSEQARAAGAKLGKSSWTGILITLTTLLFIFLAGEWYLRLFNITTDGYGLTSMNYWWYQNFGLAQDNSLGYRDDEPQPDSPDLVRIAVLGDSFAMGHGINSLDDIFAQVLERQLGTGYDVNLIADSGRDLDLHLPFLQQYPFQPNIVVYSYYMNDIDYLLTNTEQDPDANFTFIEDPNLHWFVTEFFLPNYIYYNILQFTSQQRAEGFVNDLTAAYENPEYWDEQQFRLNQLADWCAERNIELIVLVWPYITAIDQSQPAVLRVSEVFRVRGVPVVDMSPILREYPVRQLIVNGFDAHPSIFAHQLAADALEPVVREAIARLDN
ncbi:MAG: hypothetical protein SF123_10050 [Chloroflexota bacterium]|nr:hypothetical protein [Chloroflexota bacterium]